MERIRDLVKEYLLNTIQTKKNMRRRIYQLEEDLKEARLNEKDAIKQKDKYKESNKKLRRKLKER